jgi:Domain of unknown function (DUF4404)
LYGRAKLTVIAAITDVEDTMSEQQLRADLQQLKALVDALPSDDSQRQKLAALVEEMERHIDQRGDVQAKISLQQHLEAAVSRFESSHPTAAAIINNVLVTLGNIGV